MNPTLEPCLFASFTKPGGEPIATVQDVADTVAASALQGDLAELWGLAVAGEDDRLICYTGNGPDSRDNAELLAYLWNLVREVNPLDPFKGAVLLAALWRSTAGRDR